MQVVVLREPAIKIIDGGGNDHSLCGLASAQTDFPRILLAQKLLRVRDLSIMLQAIS